MNQIFAFGNQDGTNITGSLGDDEIFDFRGATQITARFGNDVVRAFARDVHRDIGAFFVSLFK